MVAARMAPILAQRCVATDLASAGRRADIDLDLLPIHAV